MVVLWIAAALLSAATAGVMHKSAARGARLAGGAPEDPALAVYRRQLNEVDDLAARGLLPPQEHRAAQAEAARRLLAAADRAPEAPAKPGGRRVVLIVAALAPLAALGLYLAVGSPQMPDQPFKRRVAAWRNTDPGNLDAPRMAAVLQVIAAERPTDPTVLTYLARAEAASGDSFTAERHLQKAIALAPKRADLWALYGEMLAADQTNGGQTNGDLPDAAKDAFAHAQALDPSLPTPRYFLARSSIAAGQVDAGLAGWKALFADLRPDDPRREALGQEIAVVEPTRALPVAQEIQANAPAQAGGGDQQAFIRRMVDSLAARLAANPDDPAGWARLVRSYTVLGDAARKDAALAKARDLFKSRPADLATVEAAARQ
ncbi:MAG: c-type cytochrome biogenesis protein CcmI [Caulobacteraceae bacterium]|nr:c-type cytochrome biogenesis protein CcmI [Caulobacteraceae bacterium]